MRTIYLSPHLDDAVLTAGGLIRLQTAAGMPVEIWTLMAGPPAAGSEPTQFAKLMHQVWGFADAEQAIATRRAEDLRAAAEVGAKAVHFDFLDCLYRRGRDGQELYTDARLPLQPDDADLPGKVAEAIAARLLPDDRVVCQLAIGGHVDHVVVRQAAELLRRPLVYDADMPYVLNHPEELEPAVSGLVESLETVPVSELPRWISAIQCYASQVDSVFGSQDAMLQTMQAYWTEVRGVRFWTVTGNPS